MSTDSPSTSSMLFGATSSRKLRDRIKSPAPLNASQNNSPNIKTTTTNNNEFPNDLATSSPNLSSTVRDLAIDAIDGSFVETTSASAARALAKYYGSQGGEEFVVQNRIDEKGRTVYRIRPISQPSTEPLASTSSSPAPNQYMHSPLSPQSSTSASPSSPNPTFKIQNPSPRKPSNSSPNHSAREWVLKTSRSIPLLRNAAKRSSSASPTSRTTFNPNESLQLPLSSPNSFLFTAPYSAPIQQSNPLRKSGSTPTLSANSPRIRTKSSLANLNARNSNSQGDVLGRLLGWNEYEDMDGRGKRFRKGNVGGGLSPMNPEDKFNAEIDSKGKGKAVESADLDGKRTLRFDSTSPPSPQLRVRSDSLPSVFLTSTIPRPILIHRANTINTSPFGSGVKLPRRSGLDIPTVSPSYSPSTTGPTSKSMREAASSETIRVPKESITSASGGINKKRKRFQDPEIFDVFQNLDSTITERFGPTISQHGRQLSSSSSIASSLSESSRAAAHLITVSTGPGDDPRFLLWGSNDRIPQSSPVIPPLPSIHSGSFNPYRSSGANAIESDLGSPTSTNLGGASPVTSSRWSMRDSRRPQIGSSPATSIRDSVSSIGGTGGKKPNSRILMAATVERLVAELTSKIEVELLCGFFLTYRSFVRPLDLLRLLITRFEWAMSTPNTPEDEAGRRIVRVRTFVVLRHWLLNFFADDFIPDKKLRSTLTDWLNSSSKEARIKESPKDQRLIKGLKKVVRKLKEMHVALGPSETAAAAKVLANTAGLLKVPGLSSVLEGSEGILRGNGRDLLDEDVDLELERSTPKPSTTPIPGSPTLPLPSHSTRPTMPSLPTSPHSFSPNNHNHPLPHSQNVITKSFTSALGSFGRFKRMLRSTSTGDTSNHDIHAGPNIFNENEEFERNETGDLLWVKGGLAKYLAYYDIEIGTEEEVEVMQDIGAIDNSTGETLYTFPSLQSPTPTPLSPNSISGLGIDGALDESVFPLASPPSHTSTDPISLVTPEPTTFQLPRGGFTNRSPLNFPSTSYENQPEQDNVFFLPHRPQSGRIELDDVDLSDEDDDVVEVKRTLKRLPAAHNLRLATTLKNLAITGPFRLSAESISSYGSPRSPSFSQDRGRESMVSSNEDLAAGVQVVPNFVLEGIDSDDDEPGDVEAALRRLEGIVDDSKEKDKARKVEKQMEKSLRLQLAAAAATTNLVDDLGSKGINNLPDSRRPSIADSSIASSLNSPISPTFMNLELHTPREVAVIQAVPTSLIPPDLPNRQQIESVKPLRKGITTSVLRKPSFSNLLLSASRPISTRTTITPPTHRSFVLLYRTEVLAQQFCLIERDLLRGVSWQELVGGKWRDIAPQYDVLDWEVYLKQKKVEDLKARTEGKEIRSNSVEGSRARWNLTVNWVCSEIVLTASIEDRAVLISKFIRLAFKCYCQSNFQTLTQIIHGLQSQDIERLTNTWRRVPSWEMRKFRNMKSFVSHRNNFKLLREVSDSLIAEYGPPGQRSPFDNSRASSTRAIKRPTPTGCIPFLGLFLRDLTVNGDLPTFLDPTSTTTPASVDEHGSLISTANPTAFSSLPPLPNSIPLQPLVNVHKQRVLSSLVQRVLAFQEFAESYPYSIPEPNVYFKCLKIRSLSPNLISECSKRLAQN